MDCIMGTPDDIKTLFSKIDNLIDVNNQTNVALAELRGELNVTNEQLKHKAEKKDITNDIQLHEIACSTRNKSKPGFWSGMSAAQKTTLITTTLAAIGSAAVMIIQNINGG